MPRDLTALFNPRSVAIVGASPKPKKVGSIILSNVIKSGYKGVVYPVNPNYETVNKLKCFKDVSSLPDVPELAVLAVPSSLVIDIATQCGERGIKNMVVVASGFKETGQEGASLEKELTNIANTHAINLLGPNCLGFVNNNCPLNATFGESENAFGNLRFISQSGAIAASLFDWCKTNGVGFGEFVTLGNKAVINENDILSYFFEQSKSGVATISNSGLSNVSPICLYLESISNGDIFLKLTKEMSKTDPILILKPGKTSAAAHAMMSHTGAIAGEDDVLDSVLLQAGVIRCETLEDFFEFSRAFAWENIPEGPRIAIISNAGGPAVISADAVVTEGLALAEFDEVTKKSLSEELPRSSSIINPIDVLGDALANRYISAVETVIKLDSVNSLLVILTPQIMTQIAETAGAVGELSKKYKKPIFCSFIGGNLVDKGEKILNTYKIPSFRFPERAIRTLGAMWKFKQLRDKQTIIEDNFHKTVLDQNVDSIRGIIQKAINEKYRALDNIASNNIVLSVGIPAPATKLVEDTDQANNFAKEHGWPVVLKLSSPGLLHKKEIGGVETGIVNEEHLCDSFHKIQRKIEQLDEDIKKQVKIQIQKEIVGGVEVIVGVKRDITFGSVLLFGAGGTYAELIDDRNLHLLPIEFAQAKELIGKSKVYNLLKAQHGEPAHAIDKLCDLIVRVGKLATCIPEASTVEINPVIVTLNDVWAVDTKVVLNETTAKPSYSPTLQVATTLSAENLATKFYHFKFESEKPLVFKPGQYISVKVDSKNIRAYSIATHYDSTHFDLLVDTRPGGSGSKFFENLKAGDKITYLGPFGVFTFIEEDSTEELLFLATGSGASAVRCMIDTALLEKGLKKPITLYFGLTCPEEIFWKDHFDELSKKYPNFTCKIVINKPNAGWKGYTGFITELVKQDYPDASKCAAYLCGHRAMISDASELLIANGMPKEKVYTERFI